MIRAAFVFVFLVTIPSISLTAQGPTVIDENTSHQQSRLERFNVQRHHPGSPNYLKRNTSGGCSYTLSPTPLFFGPAGGIGTVNITATTGCTWDVTSGASWITITSGSSGSGDGTVDYSVASNSGTQRTGTLNIVGLTLPVTQASIGSMGFGENALYSFTGMPDGVGPFASLLMDSVGNLYGTTNGGGSAGWGTVFMLGPTGHETVLYSFTGSINDGSPWGGVVMDSAGNLYGTTPSGGSGFGTVFKLDPTGHKTVLYSFCSLSNCTDGAYPYAGLVMDNAGNLYGTTNVGGSGRCAPNVIPSGCGTVFKVDTTGHETVLYSFTAANGDGAYPLLAGLIMDSAGNVYGTTVNGGNVGGPCVATAGCGIVFKLDATGHETVLYSFTGAGDGGNPQSALIMDRAGNFYGTTEFGGSTGVGAVYKLDATGHEIVLHSFTVWDGAAPYAPLVRDTAGNLYGTTSGFFQPTGPAGTVFKLDPSNNETVLHSFTNQNGDGAYPYSGVIMDSAGNLYGTTSGGGSGSGIVFELTPLLTPTVMVTSSSSSITTAQALPVTVAVSDRSGNPAPTGTVSVTSGSYTSSATTVSSGSATINIPAGSLAIGTDTLTASYFGDTNYNSATGTNSVTVVGLPTPTVTVTPFSPSITTAQPVSVTVAVSGGSGNPTPTGTVTLSNGNYNSGATTLGSGSVTISIPTGSLAVGVDTLTASYSGDTNYSPASGTSLVTVTTVPPSFAVSGTAVSVSPGTTTGNTSAISVTPSGGFTGNVTLTAMITSSPTGAQDLPTLSFGSTSPVDITGSSAGTATLSISTTAATSGALAYPVRPGVRWYATGGAGLGFALVFGMGVPARRRSWRTRLGLLVILVALTGGLIACSGGSSGGGGRGGNPGTTAGTYTITVTGTSGNTTTTGTVTLTVQ